MKPTHWGFKCVFVIWILHVVSGQISRQTLQSSILTCSDEARPLIITSAEISIFNSVVRNSDEMKCGIEILGHKGNRPGLSILFSIISAPVPIEPIDMQDIRDCALIQVAIGKSIRFANMSVDIVDPMHTFIFPCSFDLKVPIQFNFEGAAAVLITVTNAMKGLRYTPSSLWFRATLTTGYIRDEGASCDASSFSCSDRDNFCMEDKHSMDKIVNCANGSDENYN